MLLEIIHKFNWVDIVVILIVARAFYVGLKRGFVNEFFQLLAIVAAILIVFHYYPLCARFLENKVFFKAEIAKGITSVTLWAVVALVSKFIRDGIYLLFKIEAKSFVDKIGGLSIAVIRGLLIASFVLSLFITTGSEYLCRNAEGAYLSPSVGPLAPNVYRFVFKEVINKYFPQEQMNQDFLDPEQKPVHDSQNNK